MKRKDKKEEVIQTLGLDQPPPKKKSRKRWLVILFIIVSLLFMMMAGMPEKRQKVVHYNTEPVQRGDLIITITATGNLAPTNKVEVGSEISGIVKSVLVDFNDHVTVGQPLAKLDDTKYVAAVMETKAALASANARLLQAQASLSQQKQNMKRLKKVYKLSGGKAPSAGEMELAETNLQRAKADVSAANATVQQAQARLKIDESNLSKTTAYSPINGVVLKRNIDPGQTVAATLQTPVLFTLAEDLTKLEVKVDVDEADVGLVKEGQEATFTVESHDDRLFNAKIKQLRYDSQIYNGVVTYPTLLSVDNPDLSLRPGMTATVRIVAKKISDTIKIPNAALRFKPDPKQLEKKPKRPATYRRALIKAFFQKKSNADTKAEETPSDEELSQQVWVLEDDRLKSVRVNTGMTDGRYTAMTKGRLKEGAQVVVEAVTSE